MASKQTSKSASDLTRKHTRSRMSNGRLFSDDVDMRSAEGRRWKDLHAGFLEQLGGEPRLGHGVRQMVRRAATLSVACERLEADMASGRDFDGPAYGRFTEQLRRVLSDLGLNEKPTPLPAAPPGDDFDPLDAYLAARGADRDPRSGFLGVTLEPLLPGQKRGAWGRPVLDDADDLPPLRERRSGSSIKRHRIPLRLPDDDEEDDDAE